MSETTAAVPPALTPEEWEEAAFDTHYIGRPTEFSIDYKGRVFASEFPEDGSDGTMVILNHPSETPRVMPKIMALANCRLPDDSPYKITRADLAILRELVRFADDTMVDADERGRGASLAAKLAALLPPE